MAAIRLDSLEDFLEESRKKEPVEKIYFEVQHQPLGTVQLENKTTAKRLLPLMHLTMVREEDFYTNFTLLGKETDIATPQDEAAYANAVKMATDAIIERMTRECPASRLHRGVISP